MRSNYPFRRLPVISLLALLLVAMGVVAGLVLARSQAVANERVAHTIQVQVALIHVLERTRAFESGVRGFMYTGRPDLVQDAFAAREDVRDGVERLRSLTADNPQQVRNVAALQRMTEARMAFGLENVTLLKQGDSDRALAAAISGHGRGLMQQLSQQIDRMRGIEDQLLAKRTRRSNRLIGMLSLGLIATVMILIAVAAMIVVDAQRRYRAIVEARDDAREAAEQSRLALEGREMAEVKVRQLQKMESLGQLTGGIAHDFNNMLAVIIGSLDLAERKMGTDLQRALECINNARDGAMRAASLTARLLAFSRQQPLAPVPLDTNRLVAGMSELLRRTLGEDVMVETVLAGGLWTTFADPSQLENAILNLAVNARDAMTGGGRLTIETANSYLDDEYAKSRGEVAPGQYVMICVSDTGCGMSHDVIERAFDPFFTTKEVGKGTGLGLSQVFGFVKQSGGHVAIYSEVGNGTTLKLYLPRHQGEAMLATDVGRNEMALPLGRKDEVILVVEDEKSVRDYSVDALTELGYTAIAAADGSEALVALSYNPAISMLFTDVVMPRMNGRKLADEAVLVRPGIKILYTTGYTRNAVVHNGMLDPGVAFLPKPFTIAQLAHKVRMVLDGQGSNRPG